MKTSVRFQLHLALALMLAAGGSGLAQAAGDPAAGKAIAEQGGGGAAVACTTCHGANGQGGPGFPALAGTNAAYLLRQLEDYAGDKRKNAIMAPIAKALDESARANVVAYYVSLPSDIAKRPESAPDPTDSGAWLVHRGRMADGVPACASCHGPDGAGVGADFPPIAALDGGYMVAQVAAWKQGDRPAGPLGLMGAIAKKLSADDVQAVAKYYAAQRANAGAPAKP